MKYIHYLPLSMLLLLVSSCTKTNFIEGPAPITHHDTTMWEYFKSNSYDWELTMELIEHAGLKSVFDGTSQYGSDITFFGITSHSIRRYIYQLENEKYEETGEKVMIKIQDLPVENCKRWILNSVYPKKLKLEEWPKGRPSSNADQLIGTGGKIFKMASGTELWIYTYKIPYNNVPEMGPNKIHLVSLDEQRQKRTSVASHDICTNTGIVQALDYNFTLNDF